MTGAMSLCIAAVVYSIAANSLPRGLHERIYVPLNLVAGACAGATAWGWLGLDREGLGLTGASLLPGVGWGIGVGLALGTPLLLAATVPSLRRFLGRRPHRGPRRRRAAPSRPGRHSHWHRAIRGMGLSWCPVRRLAAGPGTHGGPSCLQRRFRPVAYSSRDEQAAG